MGGSSIMASAGRVLPLPKGAYSSTTTYHLLDFVSYQGSTYICKQTSTGNAPTNTTYWQIMAQGTESASVAGNYYGTCSTGASTSAKIVSIPATENFVLQVGDIIGIKFDNTNTANNPSLNVNNSGAKPIYYNNSVVSTSNLWASGEANRITIFMYDGTNWIWMGHDVDIDTDTLSDLKDTTISSASNGQVLMYDSTSSKWKNQTPTTTLVGLSDTQISSATDGQVLKYNSTSQKWVNGEDKGGILPHLIVISETGSTVTATKGQTVITATETSTGHFECDVTEFGTWTIHSVLNSDDVTVNLVVDTVKVYTVDDSHFHSDITVAYPSGATCNLAGEGESYYATGSPYTFTVHHAGNYTITVTYNGQTYTDTVTVSTTGQIFSKKVPTPSSASTNDIDLWLWFGGVSGSYSSFADVLVDSTALATLMASTDAVDYLARCNKWITSRGLVPTMLTNISPSGEAFASSQQSSSVAAYKAFDKDDATWWYPTANANTNYIGYKFENATKVVRVIAKFGSYGTFSAKTFTIQGSNNGTDWDNIDTLTVPSHSGTTTDVESFTKIINPSNSYKYYRLYTTDILYVSSTYVAELIDLQFYSSNEVECVTDNQSAMSYIGLNNYCANTLLADGNWNDGICNSAYFENVLNVKVPTMTSNTQPSGECLKSTERSGYGAYKAFDNNDSTEWESNLSNVTQGEYVGYKFTSNVKIYKAYIISKSIAQDAITQTLCVEKSSNGTTWNTLKDDISVSLPTGTSTINYIALSQNFAYSGNGVKYFRLLMKNATSAMRFTICTLQLYGREDV